MLFFYCNKNKLQVFYYHLSKILDSQFNKLFFNIADFFVYLVFNEFFVFE